MSETTGFILGAVFDFVLQCAKRDPPIVVGKGYPRDKLIEEFEAWAKEKNLPLAKIDLERFRLACQMKALE